MFSKCEKDPFQLMFLLDESTKQDEVDKLLFDAYNQEDFLPPEEDLSLDIDKILEEFDSDENKLSIESLDTPEETRSVTGDSGLSERSEDPMMTNFIIENIR